MPRCQSTSNHSRDGLGDDAADAVHRRQLVHGCGADSLHRAHRLGEGTGGRRSDVPDRQRDEHAPQRLVLGGPQVVEQLEAVGGELAVLAGVEGDGAQGVGVQVEEVALVGDGVRLEQRDRALVAQRLDVEAPRPATWKIRSRSCAGQVRAFGQRMSASPSFS
jgi:hypothetical protein